jgi:Rps23 Pro-64 3,4-dihydroxylase Tpa1-like proline 4-hydroxylase
MTHQLEINPDHDPEALNIFLVPQMHSVQLVSPFAGGSRTSYLGWLHR